MIGHINQTPEAHIVTIEDPIEFLHTDDKSQRQPARGRHRHRRLRRRAPRRAPPGPGRDPRRRDPRRGHDGHRAQGRRDGPPRALDAPHARRRSRTVDRMLALARSSPRPTARERIADSLQGIIAQRLLPKTDGTGLRARRRGARRDRHRARVDQAPRSEPAAQGAHGEGRARPTGCRPSRCTSASSWPKTSSAKKSPASPPSSKGQPPRRRVRQGRQEIFESNLGGLGGLGALAVSPGSFSPILPP